MARFDRWSGAMERALYGPGGFYRREVPAHHFSTSAQTTAFADAVARLAESVDEALGRPAVFDVVDVGAGDGELLAHLARLLDERARLVGVELRPRPAGLPERIEWVGEIPGGVRGLLVACELLDNVPCDAVVVDGEGSTRYELVDDTGETRLGAKVEDADAKWLAEWWPLREPGRRAELGLPREAMWRRLNDAVAAGSVLAIDYGHTRGTRPAEGSLAAFRDGRAARVVPDGTCDITAHVAVDAIDCDRLQTQREALRDLGLSTERPPLSLAYRDPTGYAVALAKATAATRLTDRSGLGAHWWMLSSHA